MQRERTGKKLLTFARGKKHDGGSGEDAFTLVELLITVLLVIFFLIGVVGIVSQGFTFLGTHQNRSTLNREGSDTLDRMQALILGCYDIDDVNTSSVRFTFSADINADDFGETVCIDSSGSDLRVWVDGVQSIVLSDLDDSVANPLEFTYYKEWKHEAGDVVTADYNDTVKVVKMTIRLTKSHSGETLNKAFQRYILLQLDPDDRKVAD